MERAKLREDLAPQAIKGSTRAGIRTGIPGPARRRLARPRTDRAWPRHDPDRQPRRARFEPAAEARAAAGTSGQLRRRPSRCSSSARSTAWTRRTSELRGAAAARSAARPQPPARGEFRAAHPALFRASGFADHPYPVNLPPTEASSNDPDFTEFSELPRLASTLDPLIRIYGSPTRFPIYNNEYGYITDPPNNSSSHFVSPATAATYINWAEYLSWRNSRIASTMQYLLYDPNPTKNVPEFGGFASGLIFYGGARKPGYNAYRLPLFLPVTSTRTGRSLEVWGAFGRPHFASLDTGRRPAAGADPVPARLARRRSRRCGP